MDVDGVVGSDLRILVLVCDCVLLSFVRKCDNCDKQLGSHKRSDAKYCDDRCKRTAQKRRIRHRQALDKATTRGDVLETVNASSRAGIKTALRSSGWDTQLVAGSLTFQEVADLIGTSRGQVKRSLDEIRTEDAFADARDDWGMATAVREMLMLHVREPPRFGDGQEPWSHEAVWNWCLVAADAFMEWEAEFFQTRGQPYFRDPFHVEWIVEILYSIFTGGYLQIMSPPRHGKSELLVHFCMWLLGRDPNFQIIWIGGAEKIAQKMVNMAKRNLEHNTDLVSASLPPGITWAPRNKGAGATWGNGQFVVDNRDDLSLKSDSMMAYGREGQILSVDADLIICDDLESHKSTKQAGNRRSTKSWFNNDLDSRKEEHTALVVIGSRQHPDDLYGFNMDSPDWRYIVNSAHAEECKLDPLDVDIHVECMLFPRLRTYKWLMTKKRRSDMDEDAGAPYEMIYLNDPLADSFSIFSADKIKGSYNPARLLGLDDIPNNGRRLIAGLDPSAGGYQAGFMWAVTPHRSLSSDYAPDYQDHT